MIKKNDSKIFAARLISILGTQVFNTLLELWVVSYYHSSAILGSIIAISNIGTFVWSYFGGVLADKTFFLKILKIIDVLSIIFCFIAFFAIAEGVFVLYILTCLLNLNIYMSAPILKRAVHIFVDKTNIDSLNQKIAVSVQLISVCVPPIISIGFANNFLNLKFGLFINALSFAGSFFFISKLSMKNISVNKTINKSDYKTAVFNLFKNQKIASIVIAGICLNFILGGVSILIPIYVISFLNNKSMYGLVLACQAIGGIAGSVSITYIDYKITKLKFDFICLALTSLSLVMMIYNRLIWIPMLLAFMISVEIGRYSIYSQGIIQKNVSAHEVGKTFAVIYMISNIFTPIGNFIFGQIIHKSVNYGLYSLSFAFSLFLMFLALQSIKNR